MSRRFPETLAEGRGPSARVAGCAGRLLAAMASLAFLALTGVANAADDETECLQVKGWATLEDPVRLCAYLTDPADADACEARGYRLDEGLVEAEVEVAGQFLLLCENEYVIEVRRSRGDDQRLLVSTAFVASEGAEAADAGYYNSGRERVLERTGGGWIERPSNVTWTE